MSADQFIFLDFETSGLDPAKCRVVEIGALRMDIDGVEHDRFSCLVSQYEPLPKIITELTGITDALLHEQGIPSKLAFSSLLEFVGETDCVAFNADFDKGFLEQELIRHRFPPFKNQFYDALAIARQAWPVLRSHKLSALCTFLNINPGNHRALSDAEAGSNVFLKAANFVWGGKCLTQFSAENLFISRIDVENLFNCSTGDKLKLWTKPDLDEIFAYAPGSIGGSGLTLVMPKKENEKLLEAMTSGSAQHLKIQREGHSNFTFGYSL